MKNYVKLDSLYLNMRNFCKQGIYFIRIIIRVLELL